MKKILVLFMSAVLAFSMTACGEEKLSDSTAEKTETIAKTYTSPEFEKYVSNTYVTTSNNKKLTDVREVTYRAYLPVEAYGEFEYCFYFSNNVDSTWGNGRSIYAGLQGEQYEIISASVGDGGKGIDDTPTLTPVTFGGNAGKTVAAGETFWSDPITFSVAEGNFLVWEWTVTGTMIPCNNVAELTACYANGVYTNEIPLPVLFGCNREVKKTIACLGDSITQGCETTAQEYKFWAANIAKGLGSEYSVWNLGLGYARASDIASNGDWLNRAKNADVVLVEYGTNDIVSGISIDVGPSSAEQIEGWINTVVTELKNAGCEVILFNAPPFDYDANSETVRTSLNEKLSAIAQNQGVNFFDFSAILSDPANPSKALYGAHPNDEGCQIVADKFLEQFSELLGK